MNGWHLGVWDEPWILGAPELKAVALAHAIIVGIAVFRYVVKPWWGKRRAAPGVASADEHGQPP